jgi:hypothetical protein
MADVSRYDLDVEGSRWLVLPLMRPSDYPMFVEFSEISTSPKLCVLKSRGISNLNAAGSGDFHLRIAWPTESLDPNDPPCVFTKSFHGLLKGHDRECVRAADQWTRLRSTTQMAIGYGKRGADLVEGVMLAMERLPHAAQAIRMFVRHWPTVDDMQLIQRPRHLPGGIESPSDTMRHFPRRPVLLPDRTPAWTFRRVHDLHPFRSRDLSLLVGRIEEALGFTQYPLHHRMTNLAIARMRAELRHLRNQLRRPIGSKDPPVPTWPVAARKLRLELLKLLHSPSRSLEGIESTGILRAEDAYEAWCGVALIEALDDILGPHHYLPSRLRFSKETWAWTLDEYEVRLAYQYTFGKEPGIGFLSEFISVTSDLRPDFCLETRKTNGEVIGLHLLDPKLWKIGQISESGGSRYFAEASKYLWGIRRCDLPISRASFVSDVALISPAFEPGCLPDPFSPVDARCTALGAFPDSAGKAQIKGYVMQLLVSDGILHL